jgi:hypothetical protein
MTLIKMSFIKMMLNMNKIQQSAIMLNVNMQSVFMLNVVSLTKPKFCLSTGSLAPVHLAK